MNAHRHRSGRYRDAPDHKLRLRQERLQHASVSEFDEIVGADLEQRRSALDALEPLTYVRERASILVLDRDGRVAAQTVLAGPSGPVAHARTLDRAVVEQISADRPPRWAEVTWIHATDELAEPAAGLLAAWAPPMSERVEQPEEVPWSALLVAGGQ